MKRWILLLTAIVCCFIVKAQDLGSLYEQGQHQKIVAVHKAAARWFDNTELEIIAAAYDRLGKLDEEDKVLTKLVNSFSLFITYSTPSAYNYYGNFITAGLMERYQTALTIAYLKSIRDTSLGLTILNAFYKDQGIRLKHEDNEYNKKLGLKIRWDHTQLMKDWNSNDSANAVLISSIIRDQKGFPSKKQIGLIGTQCLFILMQHLDTAYRERYDPIMFDAACKEDIGMTDYAIYRTMTLVRTHRIPDSEFQRSLDSLSEISCK